MIAKTILRDIREERKKNFSSVTSAFDEKKHSQLLLLELSFPIDIVSLMRIWRDERLGKEDRRKTPFRQVLKQWEKAAEDKDNERNNRNAIRALIKRKVLFDRYQDGAEFNVSEFFQYNSLNDVKYRNSISQYRASSTKKTYEVAFRSLARFLIKFLYGNAPQLRNKRKPLKRGIRALELSEVASICNMLELQALKSSSDIALRDLLIFRLILYSGESVHIKDVLKLKRKDIDFDNNIVHVKKKNVQCSATFMKLLRSYLGPRRRFLFSQSLKVDDEQNLLNKKLSTVCKKVGISSDVLPQCIQRSLNYVLRKEGVIN